MAEADDSGDHIAKEKAKYHYRKKIWDSRSGTWKRVGTPIKQPEPYKTSYGSIITGEFKPKPKSKNKRLPAKYTKNYANKYERKKYK
jgi:hypothetical protein